jgi:hypothetical protein
MVNRRCHGKQPQPPGYCSGPQLNKKCTAAQLQAWLGPALDVPPLSLAPSPYLLHIALVRSYPGLCVTSACVKTWWDLCKVGNEHLRITSMQELEDKHGDLIRPLAVENKTSFKLCKAMRDMDPPIYVIDSIARSWLRKHGPHGEVRHIASAGSLEMQYGDRIREECIIDIDSDLLSSWLYKSLSVCAPRRVCQKWLDTDWSSSGHFLSPISVEESMGDRLRLKEFAHMFNDADMAQVLSTRLLEGQPPITVSVSILRQWFVKYHPASGPLRYDSTVKLEECLGDHMRSVYGALKSCALGTALRQRIKSVEVSREILGQWIRQFRFPNPMNICKKRPASMIQPSVNLAVSSSSSSGDPAPIRVVIDSSTVLEATCGVRYRKEVSDLGLGCTYREMKARLLAWGYDVTPTSCTQWLQQYRLGDGSIDGSSSLYELARQDLMRWFHVEGLTPTQLVSKYRTEHGIFAAHSNLVRWLRAPAQQPTKLDNNEDILGHACGEWIGYFSYTVHFHYFKSNCFQTQKCCFLLCLASLGIL